MKKIKTGETVYIIGRYGYKPTDFSHLIEGRVVGKRNNRYVAHEKLIDCEWTFNERDIGVCVFTDRRAAEEKFHERREFEKRRFSDGTKRIRN